MILNGKDQGTIYARQIARAFPFAGVGVQTQFPLDNLDTVVVNGQVACVMELIFKFPTLRFTTVAAAQPTNWLDAVAVAFALGRMTLRASDVSPFKASDGGVALLDNIDWRGLQALSFMTGKPVIQANSPGRANPILTGDVAAAALANSAARMRIAGMKDFGWFSEIGPYAVTDPAGAQLDLDVQLRLPIGYRDGEEWSENPMPAAYLSGKSLVGNQIPSGPGFFSITPATTILAGVTTAFQGTTMDVFAVYKRVPVCRIPVPVAMKVRQQGFSNAQSLTLRGANAYLAFQNDLNAGDMVAEAYTSVEVTLDGTIIKSSADDEAFSFLSGNDDGCKNDCFRQPKREYGAGGANVIEVAGTPFGLARFRTPTMLNRSSRSLLRMPGSDTTPMIVNIITASGGQNTLGHSLIEGVFQGPNAQARELHERLFAVPGSTLVPETIDSNLPSSPEVNTGLPAKQYSPQK